MSDLTSKSQPRWKMENNNWIGTTKAGKTYTFPISPVKTSLPPFAGSAEMTKEATKHASDMITKDIADASKPIKLTPKAPSGATQLGVNLAG